jgi:sulfofructose kinase
MIFYLQPLIYNSPHMNIKHPKHLSDTFDMGFHVNKPFDVVGFGLNSVDHLCLVPEYPRESSKTGIIRYEKLPGGQVATAIVFLSRMGLKTKYIGKCGDDDLGRYAMERFAGESVDLSSLQVEKGVQSQMSVITIDRRNGERTVLCHRDGGLDFKESELDEESVCAGRILHLDGYDSASLTAATWCQQKNIPVCIDLDTVVRNCDALLEKTDFLIVSSNFASEFTGIADPEASFRALRRCFGGFLVMTLGAEGAQAWVGDQCISFPGLKIRALDTTGAGDVFHGAFIYGLLSNWPLDKIMNFANAAAGLSCMYLGARAGIRPLHEILQNIDKIVI